MAGLEVRSGEAHALVARRSGVTVWSVTLWMLGGVTDLEGEPPTGARTSGLPWHSVAEFAGEAARSRQDVFPVVGFGGELTGVVLASQFADVPASDRARLRVDQVALAVPPGYRAAPGDSAAPLASRAPLGGEVAAVVLADGRVTGMVTVRDLQHALRWRAPAATRA